MAGTLAVPVQVPAAARHQSGRRCRGAACHPTVSLTVPGSAAAGAKVGARGTVARASTKGTVVLERRDGRRWAGIGATASSHRFKIVFKAPGEAATWSLRAVLLRGHKVVAKSPLRSLRVRSAGSSPDHNGSPSERGAPEGGSPASTGISLTAAPLRIAVGSMAAVPATSPLTGLEGLEGASGDGNGVSVALHEGTLSVSATTGAPFGPRTLVVDGSGCTAAGCEQRFELTVPVTVGPIGAPPGKLASMSEPSPDRIEAAVENELQDELLITLGSPEFPGSRGQAEAIAAGVGAVVAGGLEASGIYQLRWPTPQDLALRVAELEAQPEVTSVGPSTVGLYSASSALPVAPEFDQPRWTWPYEQVHAAEAWTMSTGSNVTVGIIDEANVFAGHPDLASVSTSQISVPAPHATHVAGLACAKANSIGMVGLAQGCPIVSAGVAYAHNSDTAILEAMHEMAARPEVGVVNISIASGPVGGGCANPIVAAKIDDQVRADKGVFEHFLAGHEGQRIVWTFSAGNNCAPGPASAFGANSQLPNVLTVAATNSDDTLASFSNFGAGVEVGAPGGVNVNPLTGGLMSTWTERGCAGYCALYKEDDGTSMAAPVVAGIAALVRSAHPGFTAAEAGACISGSAGTESATVQSSLPSGFSGWFAFSGPIPIVNAAAAVRCAPRHTALSYAGSGGGDGWAVALSQTAVFNVFHHDPSLQLACHLQETAAPCWFPETETITDGSGNGFASSGHPGLWLDQSSGRLYVYATRTSDGTGGVACIDTVEAFTNTDPFCGFLALVAPGESPPENGISSISDPVVIGSRWFAFNYVNGSPIGGGRNKLLCFEINTRSACPGQPFAVSAGTAPAQSTAYPPPALAGVAGKVLVPLHFEGGEDQIACFDGNSESSCGASWPVPVGSYDSFYGAAYPLLNQAGTTVGICLPTGIDPCFDLSGAPVATPQGMPAAINQTSGWNGQALVRGTRVYVPNGDFDQVDCYDSATGESCVGYPKSLQGLSLLYTVNADPERPRCIWVNSDNGTGQIQNFDELTGGACE
jgi:hypothetical protein